MSNAFFQSLRSRRARLSLKLLLVIPLSLCLPASVAHSQAQEPAGEASSHEAASGSAGNGNQQRREQASMPGYVRIRGVREMPVVTEDGKELGYIEDLLIDVRQGRAIYAALPLTRVVGPKEKLFAVPWGAFSVSQVDGELALTLDWKGKSLEDAIGFLPDSWPNLNHNQVHDRFQKHYRNLDRTDGSETRQEQAGDQAAESPRRAETSKEADSSKREEAAPETSDTSGQENAGKPDGDGRPMIVRGTQLFDKSVANLQGDEVGTVEDLVIALSAGRLHYVALARGGVLGFGDKLFAIPWRKFGYQAAADDKPGQFRLLLDVDQSTLADAPGFDKDDWPDVGDPAFSDEIDRYYGMESDTAESTKKGERREKETSDG